MGGNVIVEYFPKPVILTYSEKRKDNISTRG